MAMVVAVRGQHAIKVSRQAYETMFKKKGYRIVQDDDNLKDSIFDMKAERIEKESEGDTEVEETETIPISEMNKEQLAEYAKEHNIDTSGARNVREARQIIQKAIREQKM